MITLWLALATTVQAAEPTVSLAWKGDRARLEVSTAPGFHVAPDAPLAVSLQLGPLQWSAQTTGAAAQGLGLYLPTQRPLVVEGTVNVSICDDAGTSCQPVEQAVRGVVEDKRGTLILDGVVPLEQDHSDAPDSFDAALAEAKAQGGRVLLDFGAVWCPPCNLLGAELLHDPNDQDLFDNIVVYEVDVDDHTTWGLKDRYTVGGYPTLVVVDPEGAVVDRLVGYPGEAATRTWLLGLDTVAPLSQLPDPASLSPDEAGTWALRLVRVQQEEAAAPLLKRALEAEAPSQDTVLAGFLVAPTATGVRTVAANGAPLDDWLWPALGMVSDVPDLAPLVQDAARKAMVTANGALSGDLFYALATLAPDDQAPDLFRAGAVALRGALTGDMALDRGNLSFLAQLWEKGGAPEEARRVLEDAIAEWPDDMTFHLALASLATEQGWTALAVTEGQLAVEHGYGDNRLRAVALLVEALRAAERPDEATALLDKTLAENPPPPDDLHVRTGRYLRALEDLKTP